MGEKMEFRPRDKALNHLPPIAAVDLGRGYALHRAIHGEETWAISHIDLGGRVLVGDDAAEMVSYLEAHLPEIERRVAEWRRALGLETSAN
jgi:hypothetical protein